VKLLPIEVWSDIACPWCYVGKRRLEAALARFAHRDRVPLTWRAFELDPSAPRARDTSMSYAARLAQKYGTGVPQAEEMIARMTQVAADDGLDFHFERIRPGNTFDAHRVLHLAATRGLALQDAVKERFFRAYLTEGEPIGEPEVLARLAGEAGLDPEETRAMLAGDGLSKEVRDDEREAREIGIRGVPFFLIGRKYAVSGAQTPALLRGAIEKAWDELPEVEEAAADDAMVCGPDGCSS
jgi:predicted DsbA family dithiol-disulfide isomerase